MLLKVGHRGETWTYWSLWKDPWKDCWRLYSVFESVCCVRILLSTPCDSYQEAIGKDVDAADFFGHFHHGSQDQNDSGKSFHQQNLGNLQVLIHADGATEWSLRCIRKRVQRHWLGCELNPLHNCYVAQFSMFVNPGWRLGLCEILWVLWWITSIRRVCLATHSPPRCPLKHQPGTFGLVEPAFASQVARCRWRNEVPIKCPSIPQEFRESWYVLVKVWQEWTVRCVSIVYHHGFLVGELAVNEQPKGLPAERPEMGYYGDEFIITKSMLIQQILQSIIISVV